MLIVEATLDNFLKGERKSPGKFQILAVRDIKPASQSDGFELT
jgi:hypothetical protein